MAHPSFDRGLPPRERAALSVGNIVTGMVQFGDVHNPPAAGKWSSFAIDFPYRILGWKIYGQNGNALATSTAEVKVYHSIWAPATMAEISHSTERPKLTAAISAKNHALTAWAISGRPFLDIYIDEILWFELMTFSGVATALYVAMRLQRT